jgi:hypothetical protein
MYILHVTGLILSLLFLKYKMSHYYLHYFTTWFLDIEISKNVPKNMYPEWPSLRSY